MAAFGFFLLILPVVSAKEACTAGGSCLGRSSSCSDSVAASGSNAVFQRSLDTLEESVVDGVDALAGVKITVHPNSAVAKTGRGDWIIHYDNCTKEDLEALAVDMPNDTRAKSRGYPENGGLCFFIMEGTEKGVRERLATHSFNGTPTAETDRTNFFTLEVGNKREKHEGAVPWNLDRIDSKEGLDGKFEPMIPTGGEGIHVYVIDTGIRTTHTEFGGRAIPTFETRDRGYFGFSREVCSPSDTTCAMDGQGHGTFVAGIIGGSSVGVAPKATLRAVKLADGYHDHGQKWAMGKLSWLIDAYDWLLSNNLDIYTSIFSLSVAPDGHCDMFDAAMLEAGSRGILQVVSAGNDDSDACNLWPKKGGEFAIMVAASDSSDKRWEQSNFGDCIDIFAPGVDIESAWSDSDTALQNMTGTSAASPHVSGAVALLLSLAKAEHKYPSKHHTMFKITSGPTSFTTKNIVEESEAKASKHAEGRLLYVGPPLDFKGQPSQFHKWISDSWPDEPASSGTGDKGLAEKMRTLGPRRRLSNHRRRSEEPWTDSEKKIKQVLR